MSGADLRAALGGPAVQVAPRLLGAVVRHGAVAVRLTEVEAYAGTDDPGSHAFRGPTRRTEVMFGPAGVLYVYFTYGMHHCANVVCGPPGTGAAVLLRSGEVVAGLDQARRHRPGVSDRDLARGPARLCRTLDIDLAANGTDLRHGPITLRLAESAVPASAVSTGPRVGLRAAPERAWRFWLTGEPTVSAYRAAAPRRRTRPAAGGSPAARASAAAGDRDGPTELGGGGPTGNVDRCVPRPREESGSRLPRGDGGRDTPDPSRRVDGPERNR